MNLYPLGTFICIIGAVLVSTGHPLYASIAWCISNPILMYRFCMSGDIDLFIMQFIFFFIAIVGVINLW